MPKAKIRTERLEIRLSPDEQKLIDQCAERLEVSRTKALIAGINMLAKELKIKKEKKE